MSGFFDRMLGRSRENSSANKAKERLQFVLFHDRITLPPERLKAMKEEIVAVISKYVDVATDDVDIALEQHDRNRNVMRAEIPFSKSRESDGEIDENNDYNDDSPQLDRFDDEDDDSDETVKIDHSNT